MSEMLHPAPIPPFHYFFYNKNDNILKTKLKKLDNQTNINKYRVAVVDLAILKI